MSQTWGFREAERPTCAGCGKPVAKDASRVKVLDGVYHLACYKSARKKGPR